MLRQLLESFNENDVVVFDRYYCSFMMLALLSLRGSSNAVDTAIRSCNNRESNYAPNCKQHNRKPTEGLRTAVPFGTGARSCFLGEHFQAGWHKS